MRFDEKDRTILSILLTSADTSKAEIGRRLDIAASAVSERIKRLEETGLIQGYTARLEPAALGYPLLAFVFVRETKPTGGYDTASALTKVSGVEEVHKIAGEDCFLVKVRSADTQALANTLDSEINVIPTVAGVRTTIVLRSTMENAPLSGLAEFKR